MRKQLCVVSIIVMSGCVMFTGCMIGPDYERPETLADTSESYFNADTHEQDVNDYNAVDRWWETFGDPITAELVREALKNNYDLKATAARVLQAQATLAEARGMQLPTVSYGLNRDRSKRSFNFGGLGGGGRFTVMSTTWQQDVSISYMLDLFGKLRRSDKAAWADLLSAEANEQRRLAIARANIESQERILEIVERRYAQGLVGPVDLRLARENLASLKALEPAIELSLITSRNALDVLLGRRPGSSENLPETLEDLPQLESLPIGLPAALLDRRPDVRAAELSLMAANERVGVSISQLYPDLTLTGSYGYSGDTAEEIFKYDYTEMYGAVVNFAQPIFQGGQIRAQIKAAKARYEEMAANYANTVITAMKEVEDALITEQMLQAQLEQTQISLTEAKAAEDLSRQRYQSGVEGILSVLESEQRSRTAEEQLTVLKGQIWTSRVNLYLALGGDWNDQEKIMAAGQ